MKRNIAIICGGDSSEHDVSLRSAQGLYSRQMSFTAFAENRFLKMTNMKITRR